MKFANLEEITFRHDFCIKLVLERFSETAIFTEGQGFGMIIDEVGSLIGVVTDGDIRRKLVEGVSIDDKISTVMHCDYAFATEEQSSHQILRLFDQGKVNLPVVDHQNRPVNLYQYSKFSAPFYSEPKIIRARVPVRVSFSGGGTDLSYYINQRSSGVLSSTINKFCTASILPRADQRVEILSKDLNQRCQEANITELAYDGCLDLLKAAIKVMQPNFGFNLETFSEFETGTGLGGSSAMTVAVIGALNYFRNENQLDTYQIADLAYHSERVELGIEGGWQDQYTTTFGGFNWVEFRESGVVVHPLRLQKEIMLELEYNLMLFRIGGSHDSGEIQKKVIAGAGNSQPALDYMTNLAVDMKEHLLKGEVKKFGDLLHTAWETKKSMATGTTNIFIDKCYRTARDLGALGGKLLGAGEAGYLLLYASPLYHKAIADALEEQGCSLERVRFTETGLDVWSTNR